MLNAKTADDVRAAVRVPFTQILPTVLKVCAPSAGTALNRRLSPSTTATDLC